MGVTTAAKVAVERSAVREAMVAKGAELSEPEGLAAELAAAAVAAITVGGRHDRQSTQKRTATTTRSTSTALKRGVVNQVRLLVMHQE